MKLLQLNAWGGRLMHNIAALARDFEPNVVCFQEVISTELPMVFSTLEDFQRELAYPHTLFSPTLHFEVMNEDAEFGNVILSRFPIEDSGTMFMNREYVRGFNFRQHDYNIRNYQHARLRTPAGPLTVVNYHGLQVPEHKNGTAETERHCQLLAEFIEAQDGALVLTGDFNLSPTSASLEPLHLLLTNHPLCAQLDSTRTQLCGKTEVCDYIFTNKAVRVERFAKSDALVSDHAALLLEFELES